MFPSEDKVMEIIRELQKLLRVQDWNIDFNFMTKEKFEEEYGEDQQAHNEITRVLNSSYIAINKDSTFDWYKSLIHELIHLSLDHIEMASIVAYKLTSGKAMDTIDEVMTVAIERTVERLADIFYELYPLSNFIKEGENNG